MGPGTGDPVSGWAGRKPRAKAPAAAIGPGDSRRRTQGRSSRHGAHREPDRLIYVTSGQGAVDGLGRAVNRRAVRALRVAAVPLVGVSDRAHADPEARRADGAARAQRRFRSRRAPLCGRARRRNRRSRRRSRWRGRPASFRRSSPARVLRARARRLTSRRCTPRPSLPRSPGRGGRWRCSAPRGVRDACGGGGPRTRGFSQRLAFDRQARDLRLGRGNEQRPCLRDRTDEAPRTAGVDPAWSVAVTVRPIAFSASSLESAYPGPWRRGPSSSERRPRRKAITTVQASDDRSASSSTSLLLCLDASAPGRGQSSAGRCRCNRSPVQAATAHRATRAGGQRTNPQHLSKGDGQHLFQSHFASGNLRDLSCR